MSECVNRHAKQRIRKHDTWFVNNSRDGKTSRMLDLIRKQSDRDRESRWRIKNVGKHFAKDI